MSGLLLGSCVRSLVRIRVYLGRGCVAISEKLEVFLVISDFQDFGTVG